MSDISGEIPDSLKSCPTGKIKFTSPKDAKNFYLKNKRMTKSAIKGKLRAYRCPECDYIHVSSVARHNTGRKFY